MIHDIPKAGINGMFNVDGSHGLFFRLFMIHICRQLFYGRGDLFIGRFDIADRGGNAAMPQHVLHRRDVLGFFI